MSFNLIYSCSFYDKKRTINVGKGDFLSSDKKDDILS